MSDDGKSAKRPDGSSRPADWGASFGAFLEGGQQAYAQWMQTMVEFSQEVARFTQGRLQEDMTAWAALAACHNPEEAMACQRQFSVKAAEQYSEEIGKLSQMMAKMATASSLLPHRSART